MRLRMVTEKRQDGTCPLCRDTNLHNTAHTILNCNVFKQEREELNETLTSVHGISLTLDNIYDPPTSATQALIDQFLTEVDKVERNIILTRNLDFCKTPADAVGAIIDVTLPDKSTYRTKITNYDPHSRLHTIDPTDWDKWPANFDTQVDLAHLGLPDTMAIVPELFALQFSPLMSTGNLGKKYLSKGKLKITSCLVDLVNEVRQGKVSNCHHNGRVARRYVSANKRESNAERYGVT